MALGLLDLSIVTDRLIRELVECRDASAIWAPGDVVDINITGLAPSTLPRTEGCQLSLYLFHVEADPAHRNTYPTGGVARPVPQQPLGLKLHYLLSAFSAESYIEEQQAMSIGLKCFHEHPVLDAAIPGGGTERVTLTLEPRGADEAARLWQSLGSPLRTSAAYEAGVTFLQPPDDLTTPDVVRHLPDVEVEAVSGELPPEPSALAVNAGRAVVEGVGVAAGQTRVVLRSLELAETTGALSPGEFIVTGPTTLELRLPDGAPPGRYRLRVFRGPDLPTVELWLEVG